MIATMPANRLQWQSSDEHPPGRRARLARRLRSGNLLGWLRSVHDHGNSGLRVLAYHRVLERVPGPGFTFDPELVSAGAQAFEQQMAWLRRHYQPVSLAQVVAHLDAGEPLPQRAVMVTFDDGYDDNHDVALPILRRHGIPALFFVSTGHLDSGLPYAYDWLYHMLHATRARRCTIPELQLDAGIDADPAQRHGFASGVLHRLKSLDADAQDAIIERLEQAWDMPRTQGHPLCRPMSWAQVRALRDAGMDIGGHGVHHRMLAKLPQAQMEWEVAHSHRRITEELGTAPLAMSYPVGGHDASDARVQRAAEQAGYRLAFTYLSGMPRGLHERRYALPRLPVERQMDEAWFAAMLAAPDWFAYPSRRRGG